MFKTTIIIFSEDDPRNEAGELTSDQALPLVFTAYVSEDMLGPVTVEEVDEESDPDFPSIELEWRGYGRGIL